MEEGIAQALEDGLMSPNEMDRNGETANVTDGLFFVGRSIRAAAQHLGTGDAATPLGALENLAMEIKAGSERVAEALEDLAAAIREKR